MQQIDINELKPHPRNNEFFDDISGENWEAFIESVKSSGVIEPIVITGDKYIVSGHQRVRACKELGIESILTECKPYYLDDNYDAVLKDLIETNIRQRGIGNTNQKKMGLCIKELDRIYGIREGSLNKKGNNRIGQTNNFTDQNPKNEDELLKSLGLGLTRQTIQNYKKLSEMIPELEDLVDTGIVTNTTALAIMKNLSTDEQEQLISSLDTTKKITHREVQKYIDKINQLETDNPEIKRLENKISELQTEKTILERKVKLNQEDSDRFNKLKSDIDFLTKQKSDLGRQIDSATELAGLVVRIQKLLETELAPIKFKRCMETLDSSDVCIENLSEILLQIDRWSDEMKKILPNKFDYIVDIQ